MGRLFDHTYRSRFSLTNDLVFYLVYGADTEDSNCALAALLNVVLNRRDDPIIKVHVLNTVQKGFKLGDKSTIMDIKAEADSGELIDVEMQRYVLSSPELAALPHTPLSDRAARLTPANGPCRVYPERTLFYGARLVNSSLSSGEDYDKMKKSIVISFIDGVIFPQIQNLHTEFLMQENQEHFALTDKLSIHFLELGKVDETKEPADMTPLERFCAYIRFAGEETKEDYVDKLLETGEEAVNMSEHVFKKLTEDDIAREMLERQIKAEHDNATWMKYAREEALAQGLTEGRTQGLTEGRTQGLTEGRTQGLSEGYENAMVDIAQKMKRAGKPLEEIKDFTGLEVKVIEKL